MIGKKTTEPAKPKQHRFAACREVSTLLGIARRMMEEADLSGNDPLTESLRLDLARAHVLAERIGYGEPSK